VSQAVFEITEEVTRKRHEFNPAKAIEKVNSMTSDEVHAFFERKSSEDVYHFLSRFESANAIEEFFGEMNPEYFAIFTTEFADKFDQAVLDAIIEGSMLDEAVEQEEEPIFTAINSINDMCPRKFKEQLESLEKKEAKAWAFDNFENSDDLWWFLDQLDEDKFEIILDTFGKKFIKKLGRKLDKKNHRGWLQEDDSREHHRRLAFAEQGIIPDIVPSGPISIRSRNLAVNSERANAIAQMADLTNGIYMTG